MIKLVNNHIKCGTIEKQRAESLRKQSYNGLFFLDSTLQSSYLAYLVVDSRDDSILYFNNQFCKLWRIEHLSDKMKRGELRRNDIIPFCLKLIADQPGFTGTCKSLQDENNKINLGDEILLLDGRIIRRFSVQVHDELNNYIGRLYTFEDITKIKKDKIALKSYKPHLETIVIEKNKGLFITSAKSARELSENKYTWDRLQKYKLLSENTRDIILFIGVDGKILEANKAAIKSYGYTYGELCHMRIQDLNDKEQSVSTKHQNTLANKYGYTFETVHKRKDGSIFPVEVSSQDTAINGQRITLIIARNISERKQMQEQLEYIARHDYLTNIPNRFYFEEFINNIDTSIRKNENTLLVIDLDNFKIINDSYGHLIGNKVLIGVVDCISKILKENDFVARLGGDEFAIFLSDTNIDYAKLVANKILNALENEPYCIVENKTQINVTASIGITAIGNDTDVKKLFSYADEALYMAKNEGKNRIVILKDERDKNLVTHKNRILTLIQNALIQDKFQIYLQPIYKVGSGLSHYEVLIRMLDGNNNILLPSSFIPLAERYGLMSSIDKWVIKNTIKLLAKGKKLNVFINLSGSSICDDALLEWIEFILNHSDINSKQIGFEITETTAVKDLEKTKAWIHKLKALGCHFALDDFGMGFSSFSYLDILPVDYLKIDGTFVRDLDSDPTKLAIVKAMNMVAHALGKKTIAEFVENESIWGALQELGVDYGQGYYLGKPAPFEHINKNVR